MKNEVIDIRYWPVRDYDYQSFFTSILPNGKRLNDLEKKDFISVIDEIIDQHTSRLSLIHNSIIAAKTKNDEYHKADSIIESVSLFIIMTMIDTLVLAKFFLLASKDYERRFMRGKMKVHYNEGFKQLFGFSKCGNKESQWGQLIHVLALFPEKIHNQHQELSALLEKQATSSTWWKDERDIEVHIDSEHLFESRNADLSESQVMVESLKLYNALRAVSCFVTNMHACMVNYLTDKYKKGELNHTPTI